MVSAGIKERLRVQFESLAQFRDEFEKNIANGGIFVPSQSDFSIRQNIVVEIELSYLEPPDNSISLDGEIVHRIPPEMAPSGAVPGVAIQFSEIVQSLRERFEPLLGDEIRNVSPDVDDVASGSEQLRRAKRRSIRVPIRVMPVSSPPFETSSRDLSATGILLSTGEVVLPEGEVVRICLWHPSGESSVEIDGMVVREIKNQTGRIAAVAVAFDRNQSADPRVCEVIEALSQAGHRSKLGGISGSIADLGLANLLQMFGSSAPRGTVVCEHDGEQGWIAFVDGELVAAELGLLRDQDALIAMLDWGDGRFEFEAVANEDLVRSANGRSLTAAILDAVCAIDEREAANSEDDDGSGSEDELGQSFQQSSDVADVIPESSRPQRLELLPDTEFKANIVLEESTRMVLGKVEEAVLDLAKSGHRVHKIVEIVPEDESVVYRALEELVESGVLKIL